MQITQNSNQIVIDFFENDQIIEEMLQNVDNNGAADESDADYDSDEDSDYESEDDSDTDYESEDDSDENDEKVFDNDSIPSLISDERDDTSDTDVLEDLVLTDDGDILPNAPPQLRRERPEDYLTPALANQERYIDRYRIPNTPQQLRRERPEDYLTPALGDRDRIPNAPQQIRQIRVLEDITNIRPRRLYFN